MIYDRNGRILFDGDVVACVGPLTAGIVVVLNDISYSSHSEDYVEIRFQSLGDGSVCGMIVPTLMVVFEFEFLFFGDGEA